MHSLEKVGADGGSHSGKVHFLKGKPHKGVSADKSQSGGKRKLQSGADLIKIFHNGVLKKWALLGLFCYFSSFQTNITIFTTNICEKCYDNPVYGAGF